MTAAAPRRLGPGELVNILRWLAVDTFRQSLSSFIFWTMLLIAGAAIVFCLGIGMEGGAPRLGNDPFLPAEAAVGGRRGQDTTQQRQRALLARQWLASQCVQTGFAWLNLPNLGGMAERVNQIDYVFKSLPPWPRPEDESVQRHAMDTAGGKVSYLFGWIKNVDMHRGRAETVELIHITLGQWVAGVAGLLLAIIWTAGFLPAFLEPNAATVLLAKPVPRGLLLLGKFMGVVLFLGLFCGLFIVGTWWALALKTGVWTAGYLLCWPLLLFHFLLIYSFSALLAVMTRNTAVCVFGTIVFWLICYGVNYGRHLSWGFEELVQPGLHQQPDNAPAAPPLAERSAGASVVVEAGYWLLPKPIDLVILLEDALQTNRNFGTISNQKEILLMRGKGAFHPLASLLSSLLSACLFLGMAMWEFRKMDY